MWAASPYIVFFYKNIAVTDGNTVAGEGHTVLCKGSPLALSGTGIKIGNSLREVLLAYTDLSPIALTDIKGKGTVWIINIVHSFDIKVCEAH